MTKPVFFKTFTQKLQEIQSLKYVIKHVKRLQLYIHTADCMQKAVNSPNYICCGYVTI